MSPLRRILRLTGVELLKVRAGRLAKVGLVAAVLVTALAAWSHEKATGETNWSIVSVAFSAGLWAAEIFLLVAGTTAIAGEAAQGTLKMILPHAYRRSDWIAAKALALAVQALAFLVAVAGTAYVAGLVAGGLGDVIREGDPQFGVPTETLHTAADMRGLVGSAALAGLASLVATSILGLFLSCLFDSVVPALSTGFLLFLGLKSAEVLFGVSREALAKIYAWYPGQMLTLAEKLGKGLNEDWNPDLATQAIRLSAITAGASLVGCLVVFTRRDLHS